MEQTLLIIVLAPLAAAAVAGLLGRWIGRAGAHTVTILAVALSFVLSARVLWGLLHGGPGFDGPVYTWLVSDGIRMEVGFLVDRLSALMMVVVTFVSLMVHVYTIGYMHDDPGYTRFFSYISLFTFAMLMLVMSNNLLQLFFGWEAVGLVSYLLIGFWYTRPSAIFANMKAFVVNRVGDFGFLLGIAGIVHLTGSLHYAEIFAQADRIAATTFEILPGHVWQAVTVICICLFIGAMGKSAQVPLHVWLPDSMEGPTPISALIHAATMVTAGIFMVARMSPLFELSETALSFIIVIGGTTALFMGFLGIVSNDIKRVVAYSTLSQLGYMTVALGVSAYAGAIYHLMTHAFFKALLFLAAGSVIIAMHHEQDMRRMGGLRKYMPVTYWTCLIGALALIGFPGFSGFFSKDALIEAVELSTLPAAHYGYWCVLIGVFVTAFYTFRLVFMTFHGKERFSTSAAPHHGIGEGTHVDTEADAGHEPDEDHGHGHGGPPRESPWVVTVPLVMLAIPSIAIGWPTVGAVLFGDYFGNSIHVAPAHDVLARLGEEFHGPVGFVMHGLSSPILLLAAGGVALAWYFYIVRPEIPGRLRERAGALYTLLDNKYYFDAFNERVIAGGSCAIGRLLWRGGDVAVIDGAAVNGSARLVGWLANVARGVQTGYLYHYAFATIIGLSALLAWLLWRN
ncbi:MAG: NADH-quinone oxidoreductase subunit L [Burkholderiaceae bacterium]|nr:NADH-quinone oxidoreductase subunit L [Burkholderiaceae bacterium]